MNESGILKQQDFIDNELVLTEKIFYQQNIIENKITNNVLKINLILYILTLAISVTFVLCLKYFFYILPSNQTQNKEQINFSLLQFNYSNNSNSITNTLNCVTNSTTCDNRCNSINVDKIKLDFDINCSMYVNLYIAGLIVHYIN